jgi:hypothetical protein
MALSVGVAEPTGTLSVGSSAPTGSRDGDIFWQGQDGNIWYKDGQTGQVSNMGTPQQAKSWDLILNGAKEIADPVASGGSSGGNGSGYSTPAKVLDTAQLTSLDSLIESLASMKDQAIQKASIKRDTSLREKQEEKAREEGKYQGKKLSTLQDFAGAKTDTDLNTRNTLENLVSSLSVLGLGGSRALTRQILDAANMSNRKANATQATNNRDLDSSWNEYSTGNENDIKKIQDQYGYDEGEATRKYYQDKQNALYKKADVYGSADKTAERDAIMNEGNSLNSMIAGAAFMNPSYTGEAKQMATPELADYTQDIARYDTTGITGANAPSVTPVTSDGMNAPGNLAVRAIAVNDKDLGIKKKSENDLGYGV